LQLGNNPGAYFYANIFLRRNFLTPNLFTPKFFLRKKTLFTPKISLRQKMHFLRQQTFLAQQILA